MSAGHELEGMCEGPELSTVIAFCSCGSTYEGSDENAAKTMHAAHQNQPPKRSQEARSMNTNTEREELARDIFVADNSNASEGIAAANWNITIAQAGDKGTYAHNIADGLIAKGYRKPRTITTAEELDALVEGSVVKDRQGDVIERVHGSWYFGDYSDSRPSLPATILHTPEPTR